MLLGGSLTPFPYEFTTFSDFLDMRKKFMKVFHDFVQSTRNKTGQSMRLPFCPFGRKGFSFELANFIIPPSSFFSEVLKVSTKAAESFHLHFTLFLKNASRKISTILIHLMTRCLKIVKICLILKFF